MSARVLSFRKWICPKLVSITNHRTLLCANISSKYMLFDTAAGFRNISSTTIMGSQESSGNSCGTFPVKFKSEDLKEKLSPEQYSVTQEGGTERAFTGKYWDHKEKGMYNCVVCDAPLFSSDTKFDSGSGWPSFSDVVNKGNVKINEDRSHGMIRKEVVCAKCGGHLGHVFDDGPTETRQRYCINSASVDFKK